MRRCLVGACAVLLVGCGGEDAVEQKAAFIERADGICREIRARDDPLRRRLLVLARPGTPDSRYLGRGGPIQGRRSRLTAMLGSRLRELPAPELDRRALERYIAGIDQIAALQARLAEVAGLGDRDRYDALGEELNPIAFRTSGIGQGYGFQVCGASVR